MNEIFVGYALSKRVMKDVFLVKHTVIIIGIFDSWKLRGSNPYYKGTICKSYQKQVQIRLMILSFGKRKHTSFGVDVKVSHIFFKPVINEYLACFCFWLEDFDISVKP